MARVAGALEIQMSMGIARISSDVQQVKGIVGTGMKSVEASVASTKRAFDTLATAMKAAIGIFGARELISLTDQYTKFTAQLRLATGSATEYNTAMNDVRRISKDAQSELGATGILYARIARGTQELGLEQSKLSEITETVSLALKASGATSAESASAMLQLSQAFGSGVLRGQEFNAVNVAAPRLMKALADGMGVPVGKLREMAEAGKLTSAVMAESLPKALGELRQEAASVQTIAGAFQVLKNNVMEFVGQNAQASGSVATITGLIGVLSNNLTALAGVILTIAASKFVQWLDISVSKVYASVTANHAAALATLATAQANAAATATEVALTTARMAEMRATLAVVSQDVQLAITLNGLIPMQARAAAAATAHAAALAGLATAQRAASVTATAASGALALLGGPIGVITLLLGLGATAWAVWGGAAKKAGGEAEEAIKRAFDIVQRYQKEAKFGTGDVGTIREALAAVEQKMLALSLPSAPLNASVQLKALRMEWLVLANALETAEGLKPPVVGDARTKEQEAAYKTLIDSIKEKTALEGLALQSSAKLTNSEKMAMKAMVDLRDGTLKLTDSEKADLAVKLEALITADKLNVQRTKDGTALGKQNDAYKALIKSINEKIAVGSLELQNGAKLTEGEKLAAKTMVDLRDGTLKLTEAQKINLAEKLEALITSEKLTAREKLALDGLLKTQEMLREEKKEYDEGENAATTKRNAAITSAYARVEQMEFENTLIETTNVAREQAIALRALETAGIDKQSIAYNNLAPRLREAIAMREAREETKREWSTIWSSVENTGRQVWTIMTAGGEDMAKSVGRAIKASILDLLYQITVRKWIISIGVAMGVPGAAQAAGASGIGSGIGSMFGSAAGSALGSLGIATLGGAGVGGLGGAFGAGVMTSAPVWEAGALVSAGTTASAASGAGLSAIASAIPVWGWAALGAAAAYSLFKSGGEDRSRDLQTMGIRAGSTVGRGGFSGMLEAGFGSSATDLWGGHEVFPMADQALTAFDAAINRIFSDAEAAAHVLGLSTQALSDVQVQTVQTGQGVAADMEASLQKTADTIAQTLLPGVIAFQQGGETLVQTLDRLAQSLALQKRVMEIQLMEAQGDVIGALAAKREDELAALDPTLRALQNQIYAAQDLAAAEQEAAKSAQALAQIEAAIAAERADLQNQLNQLTLDNTQLLALQREALDESNRALFDQVQTAQVAHDAAIALAQAEAVAIAKAEQDAQQRAMTVANERTALQNQLDELVMTATELLDKQRAALDESNRALFDQVQAATAAAQAVQDANAAMRQQAQAAAAIARQRYDLESRLLQVQDDTAALRVRELEQLDPSNRALQEQIYALTDKQRADELAAQAAEQAARAAQQAAAEQVRAAEQIKNAWQSATDSIMDEVARIRGLMGTTPQSLAMAQAQFAIATAQARAGDIDAAKVLPGLAKTILDAALTTASTSIELARVRAQIAGSLEITAGQSATKYGLTIPAYAGGTDYVPQTGPATLHQGERVMTAAANDELVSEVRALTAEVIGMRKDTRKTADLLQRVTRDGESVVTTAA